MSIAIAIFSHLQFIFPNYLNFNADILMLILSMCYSMDDVLAVWPSHPYGPPSIRTFSPYFPFL